MVVVVGIQTWKQYSLRGWLLVLMMQFVTVVRIVWGVTMLTINGYMLELFVKSLHAVGSVSTTVIHLVANFACTVSRI